MGAARPVMGWRTRHKVWREADDVQRHTNALGDDMTRMISYGIE